jgi:hypothetical protein
MSDEKKKVKISFAPGCFDNWEGTQEELDEFVEELTRQIETGEIFDNVEGIEDIELDDIEIDTDTPPRNLH